MKARFFTANLHQRSPCALTWRPNNHRLWVKIWAAEFNTHRSRNTKFIIFSIYSYISVMSLNFRFLEEIKYKETYLTHEIGNLSCNKSQTHVQGEMIKGAKTKSHQKWTRAFSSIAFGEMTKCYDLSTNICFLNCEVDFTNPLQLLICLLEFLKSHN